MLQQRENLRSALTSKKDSQFILKTLAVRTRVFDPLYERKGKGFWQIK